LATYLLFLPLVLFSLLEGTLQLVSCVQAGLTRQKNSTYECGEEAVGSAWVKFNIRFYVVALIFIIFDVEVVFLFPWATIFKPLGAFALVEALVFAGILILGLAYAWVKGDLDWVRPTPNIPKMPEMPELPSAKSTSLRS